MLVGDHAWVAIDSGCGQQYFLDLNHYPDTLSGLIKFQNDIAYFSEQKCRGAMACNSDSVNFS
jgi:hypothetical protein